MEHFECSMHHTLFIMQKLLILLVLATACAQPQWQPDATIDLGDVTPIGIAEQDGNFWLADGDHNQLVVIDRAGEVQRTLKGFERPMHLASDGAAVYVPEYGSDAIVVVGQQGRDVLPIPDSLDAPAGVHLLGDEIAIADFYNHRILYFDGSDWTSFGNEGHDFGQLYYPTDVHLTTDRIYVADAYNNRIQIFDKTGKPLRTMGEDAGMNAATGIHVADGEVFITDFENDRVLIFGTDGTLRQTLTELGKPTDLLVSDGNLYITNYRGRSLQRFRKN